MLNILLCKIFLRQSAFTRYGEDYEGADFHNVSRKIIQIFSFTIIMLVLIL
jgi:hypothetical protein